MELDRNEFRPAANQASDLLEFTFFLCTKRMIVFTI
jgi:hypothetical protein